MVKVTDNISYSNIIHNEIYEHQQWQLYDEYINSSCIIPTYYLQKNNEIIFKELARISWPKNEKAVMKLSRKKL